MTDQAPDILIVIPARGGSKGIPRKNLRNLAGHPLLYYSIHNAASSRYSPDVVVSSEDAEIKLLATRLGAHVIDRPETLSGDAVTLDPVIHDALRQMESIHGKKYEVVITMQPTSPLLRVRSLDAAIEHLLQNKLDTIISAVEDTHLTWSPGENGFVPNYEKRVNRQFLKPVYKETGSFVITRAGFVSESNRFGKKIDLHVLPPDEAIDIDSYLDWNLCEYLASRKKIVFTVTGYREVGMGHVYNCLTLANEILDHDISFLVDSKSDLAFEKIGQNNYPVSIASGDNLAAEVLKLSPDVVINDILDTGREYMEALRVGGVTLINFEDLGPGADVADLVVNAMYPEKEFKKGYYSGYKWFCLKPEFSTAQTVSVKEKISNVLLTFGGTDPCNLTRKVLEAIYQDCMDRQIGITVIAGMGYTKYDTLEKFPNITIHRHVQSMVDHMAAADLIFCSAGRTTYEVAALGVPCIVMCQNERELQHAFASAENGFLNLGLGDDVSGEQISKSFEELSDNEEIRSQMQQAMISTDIRTGLRRVVGLIKSTIKNEDRELV